jgi:hypothetical protein
VNDPNKVPLDIVTDSLDRNFFNLGLGLSAVFRRGTSAFIYYQTALAFENITKHDTVESLRTALGGQATYALSARVGVFVPQVLFEWVHEFLNNQRTMTSTNRQPNF